MTKAAGAVSEDHDASRGVLDFVHGILLQPKAISSLEQLLQGLSTAMEASAAGLAVIEGDQFFRYPSDSVEEKAPWFRDKGLLARVQQSRLPVTHPVNGGNALVAEFGTRDWTRWLLWVEAPTRRTWTESEAAALQIAASVFQRCVERGTGDARWLDQLQRHVAQQRLEVGAAITRRVAHDYGNVFTGILGFTELSLANPMPNQSVIQSYLREVFVSAQIGANLTHQLRLFASRQPAGGASSSLSAALDQQRARLDGNKEHRGKLNIARLDHLPRLAMEEENLKVVLSVLLDNAMEATPTGQPVWVEAQVVTLERIACHDYFGRLKPGPHVRVLIRDTGTGMTPDRWRRILVEPFFTTKPRHRGLGLLMAYGVLAVNQGGLLLTRAQERGVLAEFLVPVAPGPSLPVAVQASTAVVAGRSEKILVVDDDPMVLRLVQTTLEKAGYAVQTVENAEDAYRSYTTAPPNSFDLVLSDVMMPRTTGVDLARQLLRCDGKVRLLFMSGQVNGELDAIDLRKRIALVTKPFRPEVLVQAVRTAIARQSDWDDASETYKKAL